jgi:hypothetical protein
MIVKLWVNVDLFNKPVVSKYDPQKLAAALVSQILELGINAMHDASERDRYFGGRYEDRVGQIIGYTVEEE